MKKPTKENRNRTAFSDSAWKLMEAAAASTDPVKALKMLTGCLKGKVIHRCEAVEYSRSTGEPTRYAWKPYRKWDGCLWFNTISQSPSLSEDDPLYKPLLNYLPEGKTIIVTAGKKRFVVRHVPSGSRVSNHIEFTKVD